MREACRAIEPGSHRARVTTLRPMRARRVFVLGIACGLSWILASRAGANPFVTVDYLLYSGGHGVGFEMAQGVAIDARNGEIAVANSGRGRIEFFRSDGRPTGFFEHRVPRADGTSIPGQPIAVCYDGTGRLLVTDGLDTCVDVLDFRGRVADRWCLPGSGPGEAPVDSAAGALAHLQDGSTLVATRGDPARIHRFDARGRWAGAWGTPGTAPGELSQVAALAEAPSGEIVVACGGTDLVVQRFDPTGRFVAGFGRHEIGPENFSMPASLAITDDGRMWISDEIRQCVSIFDAGGLYLGMAGQGGLDPGSFLFPSGVATDGRRRLVVLERVGARLQVFRILDVQNAFRVPERR